MELCVSSLFGKHFVSVKIVPSKENSDVNVKMRKFRYKDGVCYSIMPEWLNRYKISFDYYSCEATGESQFSICQVPHQISVRNVKVYRYRQKRLNSSQLANSRFFVRNFPVLAKAVRNTSRFSLQKLDAPGQKGYPLEGFHNFVTNRPQYVKCI